MGKPNSMTENHRKFNELLLNNMDITNIHYAAESMQKGIELLRKTHSEATEEMEQRHDELERMLEPYRTKAYCPRCGKILYLSDLPQYDYLCTECEENFYYFECGGEE